MDLPVYQLTINDDPDSGVEYVALVDAPAIERNFLAFSSDKPLSFAATNPEKHILSGPLMIPDKPIYRKADGTHPDHYVVFGSDVIEKIVLKFFRHQNTSNVNLMHDEKAQPNGVYMFESFLIDSSRGIQAPEQFKDLPDGTWFGSYKVDNEEIWDEFIRTGIFKGFSVEGFFVYESPESTEEKLLKQIADILLAK